MKPNVILFPDGRHRPRENGARTGLPPGKLALILAGAATAALGLELFLVPHALVAGGAAGASLLFAQAAGWPLAALLLLFNLPVLFGGYRRFTASRFRGALIGLAALALCVYALGPSPALMDAPIPASMAGGMLLGLGFGLIVRSGGFGDAADEAPMLLRVSRRRTLQFAVWICNIAMFAAVGVLADRHAALCSALAFATARGVAAWSGSRFATSCVAIVRSERIEDIDARLTPAFGRPGTLARADSGDDRAPRLFYPCGRLEWPMLRRIVAEVDPEAEVTRCRG